MRISLRDFRCFHQPLPVEVNKLNILVGENSAGKTSFLAAIRFLMDLLKRQESASFNRDPFHLGSYEQIAHYRGGRFGRAKSFSFELEGDIPRDRFRVRRNKLLFDDSELLDQNNSAFRLKIEFADRKTQPKLENFDFVVGKYAVRARMAEKFELEISTPSKPSYLFSENLQRIPFDSHDLDLSYIEFVLRDLRYIVRRDENSSLKSAKFQSEVNFISECYQAIRATLPRDIYASAPVRSKPERTYNPTDFSPTPDGGHIPFVLAQLHAFEPRIWQEIETSLAEFGKASGLFDRVQIKQVGKSGSGPFQIVVSLPGRKSNIIDVGYGVSQALPLVADLVRARSPTMFLFQQPEVHLHPRAQAELATFLATIVKRRNHTLFVETHSDYLVDRIRMEVRSGERIKPQDVSILYFSRDGHDVQIHSIQIDKMGNLQNVPSNYRQFFLREEAKSLGIDID